MSRRPQPTLMDYVVIAINPALIIVLIGSLIYFLLEMFYQGQYPQKLHFCLSMFILGAVLIARISMENGWERAAPFGFALAVVICIAMHRFVSYEGTGLEEFGWLINYGLIALIWWCAYKLTWDCTLIDESQDASGEGLLQTAGLDSAVKDGSAAKRQVEPAKSVAAVKSDGPDTDAILPPEKNEKERQSWWQRFLARRRRPHSPGLWIVYFSLAALPMFGVGQVFMPVEKTDSRRYAFELLCVYVACALGLLLTTSFLGLRRYLRQRRLEMPLAMAGTWLATGVALIVAILIFTALVPRPNAEYTISQLPWTATSTEHDSSKLATGKEGTKDDQANSGSGTRKSEEQNNDLKSGGVQKVEHPEKGGGQKSDNQKSVGSKTDQPSDQKGDAQGSKSSSEKSSQAGSKVESNKDNPESQKSSASQQASQSTPPPENQSPETSSPETQSNAPNLSESLAGVLKWVFYGAVILAALWWLWRNPRALLAWLKALWEGWREFWRNLFGGRREKSNTTVIAVKHRSFLDFSDPFSSGLSRRASPQELVRYSFEAFEAWARDNSCPRLSDQTPIEFARQVGMKVEHLAKPARILAELYSIAAYSPGSLPASSVDQLRVFWQAIQGEWAMA